jgi:hypothetical protein
LLQEEQVASPRTLSELRPVRVVAERTGGEEFCVRWDAAMRDGSRYVHI